MTMQEYRHKLALRLFPSGLDLVFLMPLVFLFARLEGVRGLLGDGDTGWHIRAGEWMLANGRVAETDMFSYTMPGKPWYAWEWLWDVGAAYLHQRWGMEAVVLVSLAVICMTFALLYRLSRRISGSDLIALPVTLLAMAASSMHWLARPHLFTFLFTVIFLTLIESARSGKQSRIWWLPALTVLWANLHGGFFVGAILLAGFAAGDLISFAVVRRTEHAKASLRQAVRYGACAAACVAASVVNPYGIGLHRHIVEYFSDPYHFEHIVEFQTLSFHAPGAKFFEILVVLGIVTILWNVMRFRFGYAVLLAAWLHVSLVAGRNIPIYAILAVAPVSLALAEMVAAVAQSPVAAWLQRTAAGLGRLNTEFAATDRVGRFHVVSLAGFAVVTLLVSSPQATGKLRAEYAPERYPEKVVPLLRSPEYARGVFTNDEWGDYLIYKLYPQVKVFVDGRSDFYGGKFGKEYLSIVDAKYTWAKSLDKHGVHTVLMPVDAPLVGVLKESPGWRVMHDDTVAILFRRVDPVPLGQAGAKSIVSSLAGPGRKG